MYGMFKQLDSKLSTKYLCPQKTITNHLKNKERNVFKLNFQTRSEMSLVVMTTRGPDRRFECNFLLSATPPGTPRLKTTFLRP